MGVKVVLGVCAGIAILIIMVWVLKTPRGVRCLLITALEGAAAFFAVNLIGVITGVTIAVNFYTLPTAFICGLPGVISLLTLQYILR